MYIDKNYNIFQYLDDNRIVGPIFECDELIAPTISILNKAGFKTLYCCSGHATDHILHGYDTDSHEEIKEVVPTIAAYIAFRFDEATRELFDSFELPEGFAYEDDHWEEDRIICIRYYFKNLEDMNAYFLELLDINKALFLWATELQVKASLAKLAMLNEISAANDIDTIHEIAESIKQDSN